ncbi:hypothetical protein BJV74DRAFT_872590 [Russula compacta]|nr:hypothetical protein BJV74DRAFT_872590 [Russula compacta]
MICSVQVFFIAKIEDHVEHGDLTLNVTIGVQRSALEPQRIKLRQVTTMPYQEEKPTTASYLYLHNGRLATLQFMTFLVGARVPNLDFAKTLYRMDSSWPSNRSGMAGNQWGIAFALENLTMDRLSLSISRKHLAGFGSNSVHQGSLTFIFLQ